MLGRKGNFLMKNLKINTVIILTVMGILGVSGCGTDVSDKKVLETENAYTKISAEEAKEIMDDTNNFVIVDVREADEYAAGHIKGALLIPYGEIGEKAGEELPDKEQIVLVYCRSGRRSAIAAQTLVELGYTDVRDIGGIIDWPYDIVAD